jgi:hypothetical protein
MKWKSPCGTSNHIDVPRRAKKTLQAAFGSAPAFLDPASSPSTELMKQLNDWSRPTEGLCSTWSFSSLDRFKDMWASSPRIVHSSVALNSSIKQALNGPSSTVTTASPNTASSEILMSAQNGLQSHESVQHPSQPGVDAAVPLLTADTAQHLFFCIELDPLRPKAIRCDTLSNDPEFFATLKSTYDRRRGTLRRWFSYWQYDHCEFWVFHKADDKHASLIEVGFPEIVDSNYIFEPRPPRRLPPLGPITEGDFRHYYYYHTRQPFWEFWIRPTPEDIESLGKASNDDALRSLPKWTGKLGAAGDDDEFFGLLAKESLCPWRITAYICVPIAACLVFCALWLSVWEHPLDLQNAVAPLTTYLASISVIIVLMK